MDKQDIIRMAREAGFESHDISLNFPKELERFAALVAAAEREACARIVDELPLPGWREELAAAIRARGNT